MVVVTKLDRLGRSVKNLCEIADSIEERQIGLPVLDQGIDTTTPAGRLFFHVVAALGEWEASVISQRTREGLLAPGSEVASVDGSRSSRDFR